MRRPGSDSEETGSELVCHLGASREKSDQRRLENALKIHLDKTVGGWLWQEP